MGTPERVGLIAGLVAGLLAASTVPCPPTAAAMEFAAAADPKSSRNVLIARGAIVAGDASRFERAAEDDPIDEVWLDSPGGDAEEGVALGRAIRRRAYATRIPAGARCASACNFAFAGGVLRAIDEGGRFGVHMFTASGDPGLQRALVEHIQARGAAGVSEVIRTVEQYSAKAAARQSKFLLDMGVKPNLLFPTYDIPSSGIYWIARHEMWEYLVVNVDG